MRNLIFALSRILLGYYKGDLISMVSSTSKLAGVAILCILLGFAVGYGTNALMMPTTPTATQTQNVIKIGAILELSGSQSFLGLKEEHAMQLAVDETNRNLANAGSKLQFELVIQDSKTDPDAAKTAYQTLAASGIQLVVGFAMSSQLAQVIPLAAQDKVVVISSSSTSSALAIDKPYVYRMSGTDFDTGRALATLLNSRGYKYTVIIYKQDTWGSSTSALVAQEFQKYGGQSQLVGFPATGYSMSGIAATASDAVSKYVSEHGSESVAVTGLVNEEDGIALAVAASSYPALSSVNWVEAQGQTGSTATIENPTASAFLQKVNLLSLSYDFNRLNPAYVAFAQAAKNANYEDALVGEAPYSYDAVQLGMLAICIAGNNGPAINAVLPDLAAHYNGVTGGKTLNNVHDQLYQDWGVAGFQTYNGKVDWWRVGIWTASTNTITWFANPEPPT